MKKLLKKIIPSFIFYWYHWKLAFLGAMVYGWPSRKLKVIGVTGTKGKSTAVILAGKILQEAGWKTGWISSLTINDGEKEVMNPYHMTMPGRFFIQRMLAQMVKNGCQYALIEVTSEGIKQHRHRFIKFAGAVFTNLAPEHIEAHGSFEKYREAKLKLFEAAAKNKEGFGVYNLDDEQAEYFTERLVKSRYGYTVNSKFKSQNAKLQFKMQNFNKIIEIKSVQLRASGSEFEIGDTKFKTNLLGEFNIYNCAAAIAVGQACGVNSETAKKALAKIESIPGRLEIIDQGQDFTAIVDFAHTPDSFKAVFEAVKGLAHQKIISVFGSAGGGRDKWKRPEMGRIASENSDFVIITTDDSCYEPPEKIAQEIAAGCQKKPEIILDRRAAISRAINLAQKDDLVLVLGKGSEQLMLLGDKKIPWDDREIVREQLNLNK